MELLLFASFLLITPFFVFRLILTDKEKGDAVTAAKDVSVSWVRLVLASVFVGIFSFCLLGVYVSIGFSMAMSDREFSNVYFLGGLLACMMVATMVGIAPVVTARCKGYRVAVREWFCLVFMAAVPYVVFSGALLWR